jgi:hypothetical protein
MGLKLQVTRATRNNGGYGGRGGSLERKQTSGIRESKIGTKGAFRDCVFKFLTRPLVFLGVIQAIRS